MSNDTLREKGLAMRTELLGEAFEQNMDQSLYKDDPVMQVFREVAVENVFGALWTRPGLDLKTRTLICVVTDVATRSESELALHLRMALRQGWSEQELTETMAHMSGYVGVLPVRDAMRTASRVFAEIRKETA
jgi:4-carboxymuconolactone decarboxylase